MTFFVYLPDVWLKRQKFKIVDNVMVVVVVVVVL